MRASWFCAYLSLPVIAYIAVRSAARLGPASFDEALRTASGFFVVACAAGFACCYPGREQKRWPQAVFVGVLMLAVAAAAYSHVRQEIVIVPLPALFCLPGSTLGGCLGLTFSALMRRGESGGLRLTQERTVDEP